MEATELFDQFRPMVEGFVWKAYKHHRFLEKEELQSEAYLIFCETVKTYDPQKASFSTYLYRGLKDRLGNYCRIQYKRNHYILPKDTDTNVFAKFIQTMESIDDKAVLSDDARTILDFIISRKWELPGEYTKKPSFHSITKWYYYMYNWDKKRIASAWNEIGQWWNKEAI
jgi:DNA-directed RNA polymerase specialized sigma24 family protein